MTTQPEHDVRAETERVLAGAGITVTDEGRARARARLAAAAARMTPEANGQPDMLVVDVADDDLFPACGKGAG